ncbi:MAG TPA: helix-turn-helix transcriptional regulator [Solirubrobacteraceae bacterium]|nr:helix-turn-helix transcriptional regulator [Solirubrobacteraceae bacterium]
MSDVIDRPGVGTLLRGWRRRRQLSQLALALDAGVSTRHLSFVETGRARPSRELVMHLAEQLEIPLRERNGVLLAAGYAPAYGQRELTEHEMGPVREALERVLAAHEPYPAVVVDRHWGMIAANRTVAVLTSGVAEHLLEPPVNVLRLALHPAGLAPRVVNLSEWRTHLLDRLRRQVVASGDPALAALHRELQSYPEGQPTPTHDLTTSAIAVPLRLRHDGGELAFISTVTTFGAAVDITVAELSIEAFLPADAATAQRLRAEDQLRSQ